MPSVPISGPLAHTRGSALWDIKGGGLGEARGQVSARPLVAIPDFVIPFLGAASRLYFIAGG